MAEGSPAFDHAALDATKPRDWMVRFAFGGAVSVAAALLSDAYGDYVGGLLLAFPAVLPASLTLMKERAGRSVAERDAQGATAGAIALASFGCAAAHLAGSARLPPLIGVALAVWCSVGAGLWWAIFVPSKGAPAT